MQFNSPAAQKLFRGLAISAAVGALSYVGAVVDLYDASPNAPFYIMLIGAVVNLLKVSWQSRAATEISKSLEGLKPGAPK